MTERSDNLSMGVVIESLPNAMFKIRLEDGHDTIGYLSGKMRMFKIKVLVGDKVGLEFSPYDKNRGRIIKRF